MISRSASKKIHKFKEHNYIGYFTAYTASNAQVAASLLQVCYLAVIKPISGCVRIACSDLMITSLLQVVNRLDAS